VASQLIEEVTAHAQSGSLEDAREICADGTYFPNNVRILWGSTTVVGDERIKQIGCDVSSTVHRSEMKPSMQHNEEEKGVTHMRA